MTAPADTTCPHLGADIRHRTNPATGRPWPHTVCPCGHTAPLPRPDAARHTGILGPATDGLHHPHPGIP